MKIQTGTFGGAVYWLHGDHHGSASLTTYITGAAASEMRYYPFGETRWVSGTLPPHYLYIACARNSPGIRRTSSTAADKWHSLGAT